MKPFLGFDVTENKSNENYNGKEFITKTVSKQNSDVLEDNLQSLNETVQKSKLPLWVRIIQYICGFYAFIVIIGTIKALAKVNIIEAFRNAPVLILSGIACLIIWVVFELISRQKEKRVFVEDNTEQQMENIDVNVKNIYEELGVPATAYSVDIFGFKYKIKDGKIVVKSSAFQPSSFINTDFSCFILDGKLHLVDLTDVYSFVLSNFKRIVAVKKTADFTPWNKQESPSDERYKPFKVRSNQIGINYVKPYYILEYEQDGETYGIYFPPYELSVFESLTGLTAPEDI